MAMKERVEVISGQRGTDMMLSAVTWEDLVSLKLIKANQVPLP
jgi:hypothetical protein